MLAGLTEWLDAYGEAWRARDSHALADLFTEDAEFQWGPFGRKLRGRPIIREAWAEFLEQQVDVVFGYEVLAATNRGGIVRWWCKVDDARLEGILRLGFDERGCCENLEMWWNEDRGAASEPK